MSPGPTLLLTLAASLQWIDPTTVRPGQRGVCITEWTGGVRREIPVEVLGLADAAAPERGAVLVRLDDPELAGMGVPAGMSGSPVYLDGRLLGAVAFGFAFARNPIAGVTPFATMRSLAPAGGAAATAGASVGDLARLAAGQIPSTAVLPALVRPPGASNFVVAVSGLPVDTVGFGRDVLAGVGLTAVPAGAAAGVAGTPEPGEMLAVLMVWGDATLAAGGTVTARDGDTLWAFGHPLFGLGSTALPAARARVLAIQGSYQSPFKLFAVGEPFGTLFADRPAGVAARVGTPPPGIPVRIRVTDPTGGGSWQFRVADAPMLSPLMVSYLANACLQTRGALAGDASVRMRVAARLTTGQETRIAFAARSVDAVARAAAFAGGVVATLASSPFPHPGVASIDIDLERSERLDGAVIAEVLPDRTTVHPGETLAVEVRLRPHQGAVRRERLEVRIPDTEPGPLDLVVADGSAWSEYRLRTGGLLPASFADLLAQLAILEPASTLVAALESRERGVRLPGATTPAVPPSWGATLAAGLGPRAVGRLATAVESVVRREQPYPLEGAVRIPLTVRPRLETP